MMREIRSRQWMVFSLLTSLAMLAAACGGGGSSSSSTSPPPPPATPPTLSSISPIVNMQNSTAFTLTANGSNFTTVSQIFFNSTAQSTTFVNSTELTAQISTSAIAQSGTFSVTVQTSGAASSPVNFYVVPALVMQPVTVSPSTAAPPTQSVNIAVKGLTPKLSLIAVGIGTSAGSTGVSVNRGSSANLLLVGNGILPGTFVAISGNPSDVTVTQPDVSAFGMTTDNKLAVNVNISASPSAALGPRDILVTNPAGEIAVFVGGLLISAGT